MSEADSAQATVRLERTVGLVSAYVSAHHMPPGELPGLIRSVHEALIALEGPPAAAEAPDAPKAAPAEIRRSVTPDALISFIDGKPYRALKRHLTANGLDPLSYRQRFGLPRDYPMVAPSYAKKRSDLAKALGLGRAGGKAAVAA